MKKKIITGITLLSIISLVGCGTNSTNIESSSKNKPTTEASTKSQESSEISSTSKDIPKETAKTTSETKNSSSESTDKKENTSSEQNIPADQDETTAIATDENNQPDARAAVQNCINGILAATSLDEANIYFASDCNEEAKSNTYNNIQYMGNMDVTNALIFDSENNIYGVVFTYTIESTGNSNYTYMLLKENENGEYVWYADNDVQNETVQRHACGTCGGSGIIANSNQIMCSICGGTGQQYISNMYYDTVIGWHGGYTTCTGCAGSGYTSGYDICETCSGLGITL